VTSEALRYRACCIRLVRIVEPMSTLDLQEWLRVQCDSFAFEPEGVYLRSGQHDWPLVASDADDLTAQLADAGQLVPLPKESAALANVIEVALVDYLIDRLSTDETVQTAGGASAVRGLERSYPDLEISGDAFGGGHHAVDVKMARFAGSGTQTQSRITLYTGNTYFKWPMLTWPGMFRPFDAYRTHLDIIGLYRLDVAYRGRVRDLELLVHKPWRVASKQRSSTTREYIGAVMSVEALRAGMGDFDDEAAFYQYWRAYPFKTGKIIEQQLQKALRQA
jgi:hypothetical protein